LIFIFRQLQIGFEIHRRGRWPNKLRDEAICSALALKTIIYIPTYYCRLHFIGYVKSLITTIIEHGDTLGPAIKGARWLTAKIAPGQAIWYGFIFCEAWSLTPHDTNAKTSATG
jgi:hypothetical protein